MATRIFVQCKTGEMPGRQMPGRLGEKNVLMANAACQEVWKSGFDNNRDRLTTFGGYINPLCFLLIDNGPVDATEYTILPFSWKGQKLVTVPLPLHPYIQNMFKTEYQFNPANRPIPTTYTDEELKEVLSPKAYNKHIQDRKDQIARVENKQI